MTQLDRAFYALMWCSTWIVFLTMTNHIPGKPGLWHCFFMSLCSFIVMTKEVVIYWFGDETEK